MNIIALYLLDPLSYSRRYRRMVGGRWVNVIHPFGFSQWMRAPKHLDPWDVDENWTYGN